jgi:hypothetical protein
MVLLTKQISNKKKQLNALREAGNVAMSQMKKNETV